MADAVCRMTGGSAVIIGNQGPCVANLVPAAICASKERIPVIFLASQRPRVLDAQVRRSKFQYTDQPRFFEEAMKFVGMIEFGHLGAGLPYAIGAQIAVGDSRRVCLITGDSAFQFHISELETAVRKNLPIVIVVNSDVAWGMELPVFYGAFGPNKDVEVNWGKVRFDKVAEGFGAHGEYVERTVDIAPAVERAFTSGRTAVVQVAVDPIVNALQAPHAAEFVTWYTGGGYSA